MARPRQVSDEAILDHARQCFLERGPSVSTAVIARGVGLSAAALFKRFGSKEELMVAALAPDGFPLREMLHAGPDARPIPEQLLEFARGMSSFFEELMPRMSILRAAGLTPESMAERYEVPPPLEGQRALAHWLRRAQEQGRLRSGDVDAMALALLGALHVRPMLRHVTGNRLNLEPEAYLTELIELFWCGIAPREDA